MILWGSHFLLIIFFSNEAKLDLGVETLFTLLVIFCLLKIYPDFLFCIEYKSLTPWDPVGLPLGQSVLVLTLDFSVFIQVTVIS